MQACLLNIEVCDSAHELRPKNKVFIDYGKESTELLLL